MVNWRFARSQFKTVWVQVLAFGILFTIIVLVANFFSTLGGVKLSFFAESGKPEDNWTFFIPGLSGAEILNQVLFSFPSLAFFMGFGISFNTILINKDISRGYVTSWLVTPISRTKIFTTKLFLLIVATLFLNLWIIVVEMISFGLLMPDFSKGIGLLLFANFALILFSLLVVSITWMSFCIFSKNGWAIGVCLAILGWFLLCFFLTSMAESGTVNKNLIYFKYFNLSSLFNSPLKFSSDFPEIVNPGKDQIYYQYAEPLPIKTLDFAWQLPVIICAATGLFIGGHQIIKRKDFTF